MMDLKVKRLTDTAKLPTKAHPTDAGFDLYCDASFEIPKSDQVFLVPTGFSLAIPDGYYGRIVGRSGLTSKTSLRVLEGIIDSDYRGELKIMITSNSCIYGDMIESGSKIAQLIIQPLPQFEIIEADVLPSSERGNGGFGSTGV